jgi:hypothetical protein
LDYGAKFLILLNINFFMRREANLLSVCMVSFGWGMEFWANFAHDLMRLKPNKLPPLGTLLK